MIEETAQVVDVTDGYAEITARRQSACGSCSARHGCGTSLLAAWFPQRTLTFRLRNDIGARPGDTVVVGLDEGLLQRGSLMLYLMPLAGLLGGAVAGEQLFQRLTGTPELGAILFGLLGLSTALRFNARRSAADVVAGSPGVRLLRIAGRGTPVALHGIGRAQAPSSE